MDAGSGPNAAQERVDVRANRGRTPARGCECGNRPAAPAADDRHLRGQRARYHGDHRLARAFGARGCHIPQHGRSLATRAKPKVKRAEATAEASRSRNDQVVQRYGFATLVHVPFVGRQRPETRRRHEVRLREAGQVGQRLQQACLAMGRVGRQAQDPLGRHPATFQAAILGP